MVSVLSFFFVILVSIFVGFLARWIFDQAISVYTSPTAFPGRGQNRYFSVLSTLYIYSGAIACAYIVGFPIISLTDNYNLSFATVCSIVIIVIATMRLLRLTDNKLDNKDIIIWILCAFAIIPLIFYTNFEDLFRGLLLRVSLAINYPNKLQTISDITILIFGSLIAAYFVEILGKIRQFSLKKQPGEEQPPVVQLVGEHPAIEQLVVEHPAVAQQTVQPPLG